MSDDDLLSPILSEVLLEPAPLAEVLPDLDRPVLAIAAMPAGLPPAARHALTAAGLDPDAVYAAAAPAATTSSVTTVPILDAAAAVSRVVLVGLGAADTTAIRLAGAALARACREVATLVVAIDTPHVAALTEGLVLGAHRPARWTAGGVDVSSDAADTVILAGDHLSAGLADVVTAAVVRATATAVARNLANAPSNHKDPQFMVDRAAAVARARGLGIQVRDEAALAAEGFGGLVAVGGGSSRPPRLVTLTWTPESVTSEEHIVLVGKGITFDSGGLNVKPADSMVAMRTDMSGSAIVLATIAAVAELNLPVRVTALMPLAENTFGEASYRPDDVVTHYGGRTSHIGNTDAEGRLVLADALAHADRDLEPTTLLDVATLTGAARVALARSMAPIFASDDALAAPIIAAAAQEGEPLWPLPLVEDYTELIESPMADADNSGRGGAGAITAALFLRGFVGERRWVHLDIAGPGRSDVDEGFLAKGATGYSARTLIRWLESVAGIEHAASAD